MPPRKAPRTRTTPATTTNTTSVTNAQLQAMIDQGVTAALAARDANRSTNGEDSHNSGTGVRRTERVARECTYQDFMKCQPLYFKGTEGVVELTQWFERMETVFRISKMVELTVGNDIAYAITWAKLKKKMTDKYCPRTKIKKLEVELWESKVKESDKIEKYVGGLPDMIYGNVVASKPKTMQEVTKMATEVMDKRIRILPDLGHLSHDYRSPANTNASNNQRGTEVGQKPTCYECGNQGHYKEFIAGIKERIHVKPKPMYGSTWNGVCLWRRKKTGTRHLTNFVDEIELKKGKVVLALPVNLSWKLY
ncbi:hypothetical protein Tco_0386055 [Tanacetum coccineum]